MHNIWAFLPRGKRAEFSAQKLEPIFAKYPTVKVRWYDVEAFSSKASDIAVFETASLQDYYFVIDAIRDSEFCTVPYFKFVEIIPAIEDGYVEYESSL
ncbi:darcynin family protein [Acinetobacter pittii]|uniref:darcynin family protein n=1 Tax=Acinetobacter pittii TaxID=48296 RepID=UPI002FEF7F9B